MRNLMRYRTPDSCGACSCPSLREFFALQVKRKKADSARKELAGQRGAGGARVEDGTSGGGKAAPSRDSAAAKLRNPKAFVYSGRGKAKKAASRTAEREQRRLHGEIYAPDASDLSGCVRL